MGSRKPLPIDDRTRRDDRPGLRLLGQRIEATARTTIWGDTIRATPAEPG
jgi:hypothetical protein